MSQSRKNVCSAKISSLSNNKNTSNRLSKLINNITSVTENQNDDNIDSNIKTKEADIFIRHSSKMYSDKKGKLLCVARSGN